MPTQIVLALGENLAETLDIGNYTANGQKIRALNGTSSLNLRFSNDNEILLTNDDVSLLLSVLALFPTSAVLGFSPSAGLYFEVTAQQCFLRKAGVDTFFSIDPGDGGLSVLALQSSSNIHAIAVINDDGNDVTQNSGTAFIFINTGVNPTEPSKILTGVRRTVIASGKGITAKTSDTLYFNQTSFQESGILFDCILKSSTITADRVLELPDKSGTLVIDQYEEKWTLYNIGADATWTTIVITDALPNSLIKIEAYAIIGVETMGIRAIGSALNRFPPATNYVSLTVKTNAAKEIELYASIALNVNFYFSAQL